MSVGRENNKIIDASEREGMLKSFCWCEQRIGFVAKSEIMSCHTFSCGSPDCKPDKE